MRKISTLFLLFCLLSKSYLYSKDNKEELSSRNNKINFVASTEDPMFQDEIKRKILVISNKIQANIDHLTSLIEFKRQGPICAMSYPQSQWCKESHNKELKMLNDLFIQMRTLKHKLEASNTSSKKRLEDTLQSIKASIDHAQKDLDKCSAEKKCKCEDSEEPRDKQKNEHMKKDCIKNAQYRLDVWNDLLVDE
jgi:LPS O-antigen subunit length determinant protein (WzzB/FepE family)